MLDLKHLSNLPDEALVSIETLALLTGQGKSTCWRKFNSEPNYPKAIHLGTRCTKVVLGDIRKYVALKAANGQKNTLVGKKNALAKESINIVEVDPQAGVASICASSDQHKKMSGDKK